MAEGAWEAADVSPAPLTDKMKRFIDAYLGSAKFNASKAALEAGYSPKTAYHSGWENLKKPEIAKAISARLEEFAMSQTEAIARIGQMARGELPTKEVHRETAEDGVLATSEFNTETATDKILRIHGSYDEPESEVKFLVVGSLDDVVPSDGK